MNLKNETIDKRLSRLSLLITSEVIYNLKRMKLTLSFTIALQVSVLNTTDQ